MENGDQVPARSLGDLVRGRHSIRFFTQDDVDIQILQDCVALAQHAPSNSNIQPWRLHLAHGAARDRLVSALKAVAYERGPNVPPVPEIFQHYRSELGRKLYGPDGYNISRHETEQHKQALLRNYEFFGAPVCGVVAMPSELGLVDALGVGAFIQTFILALMERGLGACLQVSVTGYLEVLRKELNIADDQTLLCGIAIGYPQPGSRVNELIMGRDEVDSQLILHHQ